MVFPGGTEPVLARREASRATRWCRRVTELAGEVRRGSEWPTGGGCVPWGLFPVSDIVRDHVNVCL